MLSDAGVTFTAANPPVHFASPRFSRDFASGHARLSASDGNRLLAVEVRERLCAEARTGMPFPVQVTVRLDGKRLEGCGGETFTVIEGGWRVIRLGGAELPGSMIATLFFAPDGELSGRAVCGRFDGRYELSAQGLRLEPDDVMGNDCNAAETAVQKQFLELLARVERAMPGDQARLILMAGDVPALVLDRVD